MLRLHSMSVHYSELVAVDRVSLDVARDETVSLLGRSGSGKTSLLFGIAGVVPLTSGSVELGGEDLTELPTHRRGIGMVFQDFALFPHLDVADNVGYGLFAANASERTGRVAEALEMVGLGGFEQRRIDQLSGGQAQRVALARTLATRPEALLLDEPLGALDAAYRATLAIELDRLLSSIGVPAILVTHDTAEAFALGDRIAVLDEGRLSTVGSPEDVWNDPGTAEAAAILGHRGVVTADVEAGACRIDGVPVPVPAGTPNGTHSLLVRSGAAVLDEAGHPAVVRASRFTGPGWSTSITLGEGSVDIETNRRHAPGSTIRVRIDPAGVVLLATAGSQ